MGEGRGKKKKKSPAVHGMKSCASDNVCVQIWDKQVQRQQVHWQLVVTILI